MKINYYFVSYMFSGGFGNITLDITGENSDIFPLRQVERLINKNPKIDTAAIMYYKLITKEEFDAAKRGEDN